MPARLATSSIVVRSCPFSRISARAASSSAARVRSRLSPFGLPRAGEIFVLAISIKIVHLFYNFNIKIPMVHDTSIQDLLALYVELGELAGAAVLIWRDGQVIDVAAVGKRDLMTGLPV